MDAREIRENARMRRELEGYAKTTLQKSMKAYYEAIEATKHGKKRDDEKLKKLMLAGRLWEQVLPWLPKELPAKVGLYAASASAVVYCRRCGLALPYTWRSMTKPCPCGKPDPAVLVPLESIREFFPSAVEQALAVAEGRERACA